MLITPAVAGHAAFNRPIAEASSNLRNRMENPPFPAARYCMFWSTVQDLGLAGSGRFGRRAADEQQSAPALARMGAARSGLDRLPERPRAVARRPAGSRA